MPGEEFRVAYNAAQALQAKVVLGDRPVRFPAVGNQYIIPRSLSVTSMCG